MEFWQMERRLWLEGVRAYDDLMAAQCVMVFAAMGIMRRGSILSSLRNAPRWLSVELAEQAEVIREQIAILAYRAEAVGEGTQPYRALCTSTYIQEGKKWLLAQHQQTPIQP